MDTTKARSDLMALFKAARQERADAIAALDELEDQTMASGPIILDGGRNEEMKQVAAALCRNLEAVNTAIRAALNDIDQLEVVAQRYSVAGIGHPIKAPKPPKAKVEVPATEKAKVAAEKKKAGAPS